MKRELRVGDHVKITGGEHAGMVGIITYIGTNGGCEVFFPSNTNRNDSFYDEWDFNLEPLVNENEKTEETGEMDNPIKDSGERTEFSTGAVRDLSAGKGNMEVMPWIALLRVSKHYENGAKKYGPRNYQKGIPISSFLDSAIRHLAKYAAGYDDEDHLSAAVFNCLGAILMEEEHPDMCDLPSREGKRKFHYDESNET